MCFMKPRLEAIVDSLSHPCVSRLLRRLAGLHLDPGPGGGQRGQRDLDAVGEGQDGQGHRDLAVDEGLGGGHTGHASGEGRHQARGEQGQVDARF